MKPKRELSSVIEDYLRAIYSHAEWEEGGLGVSDLATRMGVVPSTASENVRKLRDLGLVDHQPYGHVQLTEAGYREAVRMVRRHRILETFLGQTLGFSWDEVDQEAGELEHAVSDRFIDRLDHVLGYPARDPHGDPIPSKDGYLGDEEGSSLAAARVGTWVRVVRIRDAVPEVLRHFEARGVLPRARVRVAQRSEATGMVTIEVGGKLVDISDRLAVCVRVEECAAPAT